MNKQSVNIESLIRENIKGLVPYSTARSESKLQNALLLDANESPFNTGYNRYPQPVNYELKQLAAKCVNWDIGLKAKEDQCGKEGLLGQKYLYAAEALGESGFEDISIENVFVGNGSDEAIDLLFRIFCTPGVDNVLSVVPTYGMYKVSASINDVEYRECALNEDYSLNVQQLLKLVDSNSKIILLCSPNNPTGNLLAKESVINILENFNGIVVIDEAYIDFSNNSGFVPYLSKYKNLVVLRTMSKSRGMAAIRVGFAYSSSTIISFMEKVKQPYNINRVSQELAIKSLKEDNLCLVKAIVQERERLGSELAKLDCVQKVHRSDSNFLLVKINNAQEKVELLTSKGVVVRDRSRVDGCEGCIRVSVGKKDENNLLLSILKGEEVENYNNFIELSRITKETSVNLKIFRKGGSVKNINTGIGFLDHLLEIFAVHSGINIDLDVVGDLQVDAHHTIEDIALVMGEGINKLYGELKGYNRYGFVLPMDESQATAVIDLGGRFGFEWNVEFYSNFTGDFPTQMYSHFFSSMATSGKFTLHLKATGKNDHHIAEALFKAFARAIRVALSNEIKEYELPSSKGVI